MLIVYLVKMNDWNEQVFQLLKRCRENSPRSKAAAVVTPCQMIVSDNPNMTKSKADYYHYSNTDKIRAIVDFMNRRY